MTAFPLVTSITACTVRSVQPTLVSTAHSLKRQVRSRGGQRWGFSVQFRNRTRAEISQLMGFMLAQRGQYTTFTFVPPVVAVPQTTVSGTPLVNGAHAAGLRSIVTDGWVNSVTAMNTGEFIKFGGHAKVYMLTADVATSGSGEATLSIEPGLYSALANNEALTVTSVPFTCCFASDAQEISLVNGTQFDWSCDLIESP